MSIFTDREKNKNEQRAVAEYRRSIDDILSREEDIIKTIDEKKNLSFAVTEADFLLSDIKKLLERMEQDDIDSPGIKMQIALMEEAKERILTLKSDISSGERSLGDLSEDMERRNRFIKALKRDNKKTEGS